MQSVLSWWGTRSSAQRLDLSARSSLYAISALEPVVALLIAGSQREVQPVAAAAFLLVAVGHTGLCLALLRASLSTIHGRGRPGRALVTAGIAATAAGIVLAGVAFPARPAAAPESAALLGGLLFSIFFLAAVSPSLDMPRLLGTAAVVGAVLVGWVTLAGIDPSGWRTALWAYVSWAALLAGTYAGSAWMIHLIWEIERARTAEARLAVAEERLRIARDLHDVLGHNLSLIAVKSDLAGELVRRGDDRALAELTDVRRVAHESLQELRAVVGGYRTSSLAVELTGAQSVLRSAGIRCHVLGDVDTLPDSVHSCLAWAVREGTTNVIRHSDATFCTIEVAAPDGDRFRPADGASVSLRMINDGIRDDPAAPGIGLAGLRERLAAAGGTLVAAPRGRQFVLEASVPLRRPGASSAQQAAARAASRLPVLPDRARADATPECST